MLKGKNVVVGVSGGIACYKACELVSRLKKLGANVDVVMTAHAMRFVTPLTFQTLAGSAVTVDEFAPVDKFDIHHISLAKKADIIVIAPATADVIAKLAAGIADDLLTTTYLASKATKLICPAMNTAMYEAPVTQRNMDALRKLGALFLEPDVGRLACGDVGKGRMAEPQQIADEIVSILRPCQSLDGKRVLITAGGTEENIDPVRVITNRSSGKMGVCLAQAVAERGGEVSFVHGNMSVPAPDFAECTAVRTTQQMLDACLKEFERCDVAILAGAPADYKPVCEATQKLKSQTLVLELVKNPDIAKALSAVKGDKKLVIFAAETSDLKQNANKKLTEKGADMVVANDVTLQGAGFDSDTNIATIIDKNGEIDVPLVDKRRLANIIIDRVIEL